MAKKAILTRLNRNDKQTTGKLILFDNKDILFGCFVLELPWKDNQRNISCIPEGRYHVKPRWVEHRGNHFILEGVPGRSLILIHSGNYYTDIQGCILPGNGLTDINRDGYKDVVNSRLTLNQLVSLAPEGFELVILNL